MTSGGKLPPVDGSLLLNLPPGNLASPPPIGNTTPNTVAATALTATTATFSGETIVPNPVNLTDAVNLQSMQSNGSVSNCTLNSFGQYLASGTVIGCAPNLTEGGGTLNYLGNVVLAASFATNGLGAGQWTSTCGTLQTAGGPGTIGITAPTTCSQLRIMNDFLRLTYGAEGDVNVVEDLIPMRHWLRTKDFIEHCR